MMSNKDLVNDINYNEVLDDWHDKAVEKATEALEKAYSYVVGSTDYYKYKYYAEGIYVALAMLSVEERKAKRKLHTKSTKDSENIKY